MKRTNRSYQSYYVEYVNHILRFYTRHPNMIHFETEVDRINHRTAKNVLQGLPTGEIGIIFDVYTRNDTFGDNVHEVAQKRNLKQDDIYTLIARVSNLIAKERGLI